MRKAYEHLSFEDAARILMYQFGNAPKELTRHMETLLTYTDQPYYAIAPAWYEEYKEFTNLNKKQTP